MLCWIRRTDLGTDCGGCDEDLSFAANSLIHAHPFMDERKWILLGQAMTDLLGA